MVCIELDLEAWEFVVAGVLSKTMQHFLVTYAHSTVEVLAYLAYLELTLGVETICLDNFCLQMIKHYLMEIVLYLETHITI